MNKVIIIIIINPCCLDQIVFVTSLILCKELNVGYRVP